jgi:outer membrane protein assembly factor BamB
MTVPGALQRLLAIVVFAAALPCRGEEAISGRWEGTTHIPDDDLNVIVDLAQENSTWVGSIIVPGLDVKGVPLTDITVKASAVSFSVKGALGIQLKLQLDGSGKLTGNFEQAGWVLTADRKFNVPFLYHSNWREAPIVANDQQIRIGGVFSSPLVVNGVVYFGSADGYLYALE